MRGFVPYGLLKYIVFVLVSLVFVQGCTRSVLQTYPADEQEIDLATESPIWVDPKAQQNG